MKTLRANAQKAQKDGNFKNAFELYSQLLLPGRPEPGSREFGDDLRSSVNCLSQLQREAEIDEFREKVIEQWKGNPWVLRAAAETLTGGNHYGYIIAGKFSRGYSRNADGRYVTAFDRDRVRALQLYLQAIGKFENAGVPKPDQGEFHQSMARTLLQNQYGQQSWRLQVLTGLTELPDYEDGNTYYGNQATGAPVDAGGNPIYHALPKSWDAAKSDGERWRWVLDQYGQSGDSQRIGARMQLANFMRSQMDVQTLAQYAWIFRGRDAQDKDSASPYQIETLGEDETLARLASGVKRFKLPDEFNFIKIYREIAGGKSFGHEQAAWQMLAQIFEDRRQYVKAAGCWRKAIALNKNGWYQSKLDQITGNWGQFEPVADQPAGMPAKFGFRFRNAKKVTFSAREVNVAKLLGDVKAYLNSVPAKPDWNRMQIQDAGYQFVQDGKETYLGNEVANWDAELQPAENYFDRQITVESPLKKGGAYFVTAKIDQGNTCHILLWLSDLVIVKKAVNNDVLLFLADSVTGQPAAGVQIDAVGYHSRWENNTQHLDVLNFQGQSDASGIVSTAKLDSSYQWLISASAPDGRSAYLGFTSFYRQAYSGSQYSYSKVYAITDRPVYRPGHTVKYKLWFANGNYGEDNKRSAFAGQTYQVKIFDPRNQEVFKQELKTDDFGGLDGEFKLGKSAVLGVYAVQLWQGDSRYGGGSFRVEEYKKPEFEVKVDAPTEPVMLGEKIPAKITAKYYFGAPVTEAKVKYKVLRHNHTAQWYPAGLWDWFYEPGYWWFACDYEWYPGWHRWGCRRPVPWWQQGRWSQPEVVLENEAAIGADGTIKFEIDSAFAKAAHPDLDHRYEITVEVTDNSRRTITGSGSILVARDPFKVYAWVDRGYYRVGDTIGASFSARTLAGKPVKGAGVLKLLKIEYDAKLLPVEKAVQEWNLETNEEGNARQQIKASAPGQYRLSYTVTDEKKHAIEGGYVFCVSGEGFDASKHRFNDIELVIDKREYKPGEKVRLMINTNRAGSTVLLFQRFEGVFQSMKMLTLKDKSAVEEIEVAKGDMPNFFVEAVTVSNGKLHSEVREIVVPPEERVLNVEVKAGAAAYKPGQTAKAKVKITDIAGKPFAGAAVVSVYDKAVEYISGGSNVPEIKSFFWKWRRHYYMHTESSLIHWGHNLVRQNTPAMQFIGTFGHMLARSGKEREIIDRLDVDESSIDVGGGGGGGYGTGRAMGKSAMNAAAAPCSLPVSGEGAFMENFKAEDSRDKKSGALADAEGRGEPGGGGTALPQVRKNFADTAYWNATLNTGADGTADVEWPMPESLTTWKVKVWAMGSGTRVGQGEAEAVTTKNLIVRLQAPRFFQEKDEVVLSANVHNYLKEKKAVKVVLELDGGCLENTEPAARDISVEASGEARVDWRVRVTAAGNPSVRVKALTNEESDAMELRFPALVHGMLKTESYSGAVRRDQNGASITVSVPSERREDESRLEVRYSPTLAGAMVDALPYMVDYPYGCTEQTLSRFLPTVMTQRVLRRMKIDLAEVARKQTNLNAQEIGNDQDRARQWKRFPRNPVFDAAEVEQMAAAGLTRLASMQCGDGGWGWFSGAGEHSSPHTTAYVVHGLQIARENEMRVDDNVLNRGVNWLKNFQKEQIKEIKKKDGRKADNLDAFVYMVLVDGGDDEHEMRDFLYRDRAGLSVYGKTMLALALHKKKQQDKFAMVLRNIEQFLAEDDENQTAYLKMTEGNCWWYWHGSEIESQAYYLKLLARTEPKSGRAAGLAKYLINNRKHAAYWASTRDTALCVEALAEYLTASGEDQPDLTLEILVDGKKAKEVKIDAANLFTFDNKFVLAGKEIASGKHTVEFRKTGNGPLYFNAYMTNFTLEEQIKKAGLEIKVERKYYRLKPVDKKENVAGSQGQVVSQKVEKYERELLADMAVLKSGELAEVELEIDSKNDYEYVIFEDMKAAGFEPVEVRSGYTQNDMRAYAEFRDEKVCFFVQNLGRGKHSVSCRMRAEIPGKFNALPARGFGMYAPELQANSDENRFNIKD